MKSILTVFQQRWKQGAIAHHWLFGGKKQIGQNEQATGHRESAS